MARKERLFRRMPAQPMSEVMMPSVAARVEIMSSGRFPVRTTSACFHMLNHVRRAKMSAVRVYTDSYKTSRKLGADLGNLMSRITYEAVRSEQCPLEPVPSQFPRGTIRVK